MEEEFDIEDFSDDFPKVNHIMGFISDVIKPAYALLLGNIRSLLNDYVLSDRKSPWIPIISAQEFIFFINTLDCKDFFVERLAEILLNKFPNINPEEFIDSLSDAELHKQFIKCYFKGDLLGFYNNIKAKFCRVVAAYILHGHASDEEVKRYKDHFGEDEVHRVLSSGKYLYDGNLSFDSDAPYDPEDSDDDKPLSEQIKTLLEEYPKLDQKYYDNVLKELLSSDFLDSVFEGLEHSNKPNRNKKILKILADDRYTDLVGFGKEHYEFTKKDSCQIFQDLSKKTLDIISSTPKSDQPGLCQTLELCKESQMYHDIVYPVYELLVELDSETPIHRDKQKPISVEDIIEDIEELKSKIFEDDFLWYKYLDGRINGILPLDNDKEIKAIALFEKIKALIPDVLKELSKLSEDEQAVEVAEIIQRFGQYSNALTSSLITPVEDEPSIAESDEVDEGKNEESGQESNQNLTPRLPRPHDFNIPKMKNLNMELLRKGLLDNIKDDVFLYWFSFKNLEAEPPKMYWPGSVPHLRALLNILYDGQTKIGYVCKIAGSIFVKKKGKGKGYTSLSKTNTDKVKGEIEYLVRKAIDG